MTTENKMQLVKQIQQKTLFTKNTITDVALAKAKPSKVQKQRSNKPQQHSSKMRVTFFINFTSF